MHPSSKACTGLLQKQLYLVYDPRLATSQACWKGPGIKWVVHTHTRGIYISTHDRQMQLHPITSLNQNIHHHNGGGLEVGAKHPLLNVDRRQEVAISTNTQSFGSTRCTYTRQPQLPSGTKKVSIVPAIVYHFERHAPYW